MRSLFVCGRWLDKLGLSAQKDIGVVMRQTLYGYNYALLDIDMNPNPVGTHSSYNNCGGPVITKLLCRVVGEWV